MAYSRRLFFFDQTVIGENKDDLFSVLEDAQPVCYATGRGFLWVGDSYGRIHRFNRGLQVSSFKAHSTLHQAFQLKEHDVLLTIGIDDNTNDEQLKVWNLTKWTNKSTPFCYRSTSVAPNGQLGSHVTCLYAHENLQLIVLGHTGGQVQIFRGDITRERNCKRQLLHTFPSPVTGIGLDVQSHVSSRPADGNGSRMDHSSVVVYATSDHYVMSFAAGRRDDEVSKMLLDRFGAGPRCSQMVQSGDSLQYAVARSDAVYFYNPDGRGPCVAMDGNKLALTVFRQYLVLVVGQSIPNVSTTNGDSVCVTIHDQQNKFLAGEFLIHGFQVLFVEWDGIHVVRADTDPSGLSRTSLVCLTEKCAQAKLETLYAKKNFQLALEIAKMQNMDKEQLAQIHWRFADHLYKQKEYDAAVKEYVETIGILESSFVIQRFLEGGHLSQLSNYLEALNSAGLASSDHLVLLLNCYARLQDHSNLARFVQEPINPQLDILSAIKMLRQFNFPQIALQLARSSGRYSDQVCILIEDLDDSRSALDSITQFPFDEALKAVCNYGHLLIDRMPAETVRLLGQLCTHPDASHINVHQFLKIFMNNRVALMQFLERYVTTRQESIKLTGVVDALLELALYERSLSECTSSKLLPPKRSKEELSAMILGLLRDSKLPYDENKALILCHRRGLFEACVYLWEKLRSYDQLVKHYMDLNLPKDVLDVCKRFGSEMPKLWLLALHYFATKPECPDELRTVVSEIDQQNLASPLAVLDILSNTDEAHSCQIGTVRDYLLRHLEAETNYIKILQQGVQELRSETMHNRAVVRTLTSQVKVFQQRNCALCQQSLDLPSVHFLCEHSYHKLCFENYSYGDQQCPQCVPKNNKILAELAASSSGGFPPDQVFDQLRGALHPEHVPSLEATEHCGSPLAKNVAGRILMRMADPSHNPTFSSSLIRTPVAPIIKVVGSHRSSFDILPQKIPENVSPPPSFNIPSAHAVPVTVQTKSTSLGYHSTKTADEILVDPTTRISLNPFDQPESNLDQTETIETIDAGLGSSLNPFDSN